jgi:hypothetical protein
MDYFLRIPVGEIQQYVERYDYPEGRALERFHGIAQAQGHLTTDELHEICRWKSKRRADLARQNPDSLVHELTSMSFRAKSERARIGSLLLLDGVHFPTASAILHFCFDQSYPILDFRALWSLDIEEPKQYSHHFWEEYVVVCRSVAKQHQLSLRELDMALWQYSAENQGPR